MGRYTYGLGIAAIGSVCLAWRDFILGQPVSRHLPARTALACIAGAFLLLAGAALQWRRSAAWSAAALTAYYALIVVVLMNGRVLLAHYREYGTYSGIAEPVAIAAAALVLYADLAGIEATLATRLIRLGLLAFGICSLLFGGAHFVYMNLTAPLVPKWLPPSQLFWGYVTGIAFIAAGIALLVPGRGRLAAVLLTVMLASFALLIHLPMLFANHASRMNWTEAATNLALVGAAWVIADSLQSRKFAQG